MHTPLGRFGLAVDAGVAPWVSVSAGVGLDTYFGKPSFWLAFMPRLRLPLPWLRGSAVALGVGASRGKNESHEGLAIERLDCELSVEQVFAGGLRIRGFGGIGFASRGSNDGELGLAIGYALWPNPVVPPDASWSIGRWYGWQGLALDAAAAAIAAVYRDDFDGRKVSTRAASAFFVVGGPTVHFSHRRYGRTAISLALRTLLPLAFYGLMSGGESGEPGLSPGALLTTGAVLASLIDDIALAWQ
jgi:hypothetical protein